MDAPTVSVFLQTDVGETVGAFELSKLSFSIPCTCAVKCDDVCTVTTLEHKNAT